MNEWTIFPASLTLKQKGVKMKSSLVLQVPVLRKPKHFRVNDKISTDPLQESTTVAAWIFVRKQLQRSLTSARPGRLPVLGWIPWSEYGRAARCEAPTPGEGTSLSWISTWFPQKLEGIFLAVHHENLLGFLEIKPKNVCSSPKVWPRGVYHCHAFSNLLKLPLKCLSLPVVIPVASVPVKLISPVILYIHLFLPMWGVVICVTISVL